MTALTTALALWCLAAPLQAPSDPAGDLPPAFEPTPTTTVAPKTTPQTTPQTTPSTPAPLAVTIVVLPMIGLGVDEDLRARTTKALTTGVAGRAVVVDGATLPAATREALATCESFRCSEHLDPLGADFVVTSSLGRIGTDVVLTVRLRSVHTVQRLQVQGPASDVDGLAVRAVAALPLDKPPPAASAGTTERKPGDQPPSPPTSRVLNGGPYPPEVMILVFFALGLVPVAGSPLLLPLVQGFVAEQVGPELVGLEYKSWAPAVVAGYATYLVGGTIGIGTYVSGAVIAATTGNTEVGVALVAVGGLTMLATVVAEPIVFHLVSSMNAVPVDDAGPSR